MTVFALPDLGEGLTEAEVVAWHVSPGDHVVRDAPLVSVETDKAVVEIPSPFSGTVRTLHAEPGDLLEIGAPLVDIATEDASDAGAIVGDAGGARETPHRAKAAPAVRRLAEELGVELASLTGSGPGGTILSADVQAAANAGRGSGEPLRGVRRAMAKAMALSGASVVPATLTDRADVSGWPAGARPTLRLVRAVVAGCAAEPALNAGYEDGRRIFHDGVDLAVAVDAPDGLFAPVLRRVDLVPPDELARTLDALVARVADRSATRRELAGGTFTLSNFGALGGLHAALVVTPPQVAILGAGRIHDAVLAIEGSPLVRRVLPLSLTFDHRVVTGGEAARFLTAAKADLEAGQ